MDRLQSSPSRGRRDAPLPLHDAWDALADRFAMGHDVQILHGAVSRVDRSIDRMVVVKAQGVEPATTQEQESEDRHDAVTKFCGLPGSEAKAVHRIAYARTHTECQASIGTACATERSRRTSDHNSSCRTVDQIGVAVRFFHTCDAPGWLQQQRKPRDDGLAGPIAPGSPVSSVTGYANPAAARRRNHNGASGDLTGCG
jgi:hypothetical protein